MLIPIKPKKIIKIIRVFLICLFSIFLKTNKSAVIDKIKIIVLIIIPTPALSHA